MYYLFFASYGDVFSSAGSFSLRCDLIVAEDMTYKVLMSNNTPFRVYYLERHFLVQTKQMPI